MNLSEVCIRRPVMTTLLMAALLIFGLVAYRALPVSELPNVDFPTISVTASLPGASPETMAAAVATPLEGQFSTIAGLDSMTSTSALGSTSITLQFDLDRNIDAAAQDVQSAISQATCVDLPAEHALPPSLPQGEPGGSPSFYLALSSLTLPLSLVNEYAQTNVAQRMSTMVQGVAQVQVYRFAEVRRARAGRPAGARLAGHRHRRARLRAAAQQQRTSRSASSRPSASTPSESSGQLMDAAAYEPLVVTWRNGAPVRLERHRPTRCRQRGERPRRQLVHRHQRRSSSPCSASRAPTRSKRRRHPAACSPVFPQELPACVELEVLFDRSVSIRASIDDVSSRCVLTIGLWCAGHLALPAERVRNGDPQSGTHPISDRRHLRRHVLLGYSLEQPLTHGPHPRRRPRSR
jgi:HAE1 family hydrophobic/amphiphilic exporter-1